MANCFGGRKVVGSSGNSVGDLIILLPYNRADSFFENEFLKDKVRIHLACPTQITAFELKKRISGKINGCIPATNIRLTFCGEVLQDTVDVPFQIFESTEKLSEDADVFRPRVVLTIRHLIHGEEDVDSKEIKLVESKVGLFGLLRKGFQSGTRELTPKEVAAEEERLRLEEEEAKVKAEEEEKIKLLHEQKLQEKQERDAEYHRVKNELKLVDHGDFNLKSELAKIHCEVFYEQFSDLGYTDEVCDGILLVIA